MRDWAIRSLLFLIFAALILNAVLLARTPGQAADNQVGQYQISAFGVQDRDGKPTTGFFILNTKTGAVKPYTRSDTSWSSSVNVLPP
jgi:hypothetical protein